MVLVLPYQANTDYDFVDEREKVRRAMECIHIDLRTGEISAKPPKRIDGPILLISRTV